MQYALGHFLDLSSRLSSTVLRFQNFYAGETVDERLFLPFGFSGTTTNRQADNLEATLVFPNNELSRSWAMQVLDEGWAAYVEVYLMDPDDSSKRNQLYGYTGQVMGGGWDETALNLRLGTVLDAVEGNIPNRVLHRGIVGKIPPSSVAGL